MATDTERSGSWSELEQGFFSTAPPEVPEPPPEPMRFDDLDVGMPPRPDWRARMRRVGRAGLATASAARGALRPLVVAAARRSVPVMARARQTSIRVSTRLVTTLRSRARDRRMIAAAATALIVVMGVSAGVVASRGAARPTPASDPVAAMPAPVPTPIQPPPAPSDLLSGFEDGALASMVPVEARATKLPQPLIRKLPARAHKHATGPAKHSAPAKRPTVPAARPAVSR